MPLAQFLANFQLLPPLPTNKLGAFLVLIPRWWVGLCSRTLWVSPTNSPVRLGVSPIAVTPTDFYSQRIWGFLFPCWDPWLRGLSCYTSSLLSLPISTPPASLNECFFFNSLSVTLHCSSIFWQLWLFFVFEFVVVLLVVQGGKVYLPTPPSWPELCNFKGQKFLQVINHR